MQISREAFCVSASPLPTMVKTPWSGTQELFLRMPTTPENSSCCRENEPLSLWRHYFVLANLVCIDNRTACL